MNSEKKNASNMMFGIAQGGHSTDDWIGCNDMSFSINRNTGMKVHKGSGVQYANVNQSNVIGESITIILDTRMGVLSFKIGKKYWG